MPTHKKIAEMMTILTSCLMDSAGLCSSASDTLGLILPPGTA